MLCGFISVYDEQVLMICKTKIKRPVLVWSREVKSALFETKLKLMIDAFSYYYTMYMQLQILNKNIKQ